MDLGQLAAGELTATPAAPVGEGAAAAVAFREVTHRYGTHRALDGLNMEIPRGQTVALLGPNGAGKSTTASLLLGLAGVQQGSVEVLGRRPRDAVR